MKDIVFVSAFYDIGRSKWNTTYTRPVESYIDGFIFLANNITYDLIVFIEEKYLKRIKSNIIKKNIIFLKIEDYINDLFIKKYYDINNKIINSRKYKEKIPENRKNKPEHTFALYNLINHDKVNFVKISKKLYNNYKFYSWIDFGLIDQVHHKVRRPDELIPYNMNIKYLNENKIIYQSSTKKLMHIDPRIMLSVNEVFIYGTFWICPNKLVEKFQNIYENELILWNNMNIVDDDQSMVFQLIFKYDIFKLYYNANFFALWKVILNMPIDSKIVKSK